MNKLLIGILLVFASFACHAANVIDPVGFEQIWFQNNQRNVVKRYHYYNKLIRSEQDNVYFIGLDAAPDKKIATSEGDKNALISRMDIRYQDRKYLFSVDWFSAIPQPQETEGFTYGDFIVARSWDLDEHDSYLTLGLRQISAPRSVLFNGQVVFDATNDATKEEYSLFMHLNYQGYDLGTYYSENNALEALSFYKLLFEDDNSALTSTLFYYGKNEAAQLDERYELSLDYSLDYERHELLSAIVAAFPVNNGNTYLSNAYATYKSPAYKDFRLVLGGYYAEVSAGERLTGSKLGVAWSPEEIPHLQIGLSMQKNAIGDFHALTIPDEQILTFYISGYD